ncbi:hypothetical protein WR25_21631, partial [Diploscapter pachys]
RGQGKTTPIFVNGSQGPINPYEPYCDRRTCLLTKMLANLPVEIILSICEYPEFKDLGQLAWANKRTMQIIKKHLPMALERRNLFYRPDLPGWRNRASVTYFKDKLYYLGGNTNRVDLLMSGSGEVERYIDYQTTNGSGLKSESFKKNNLVSELHH